MFGKKMKLLSVILAITMVSETLCGYTYNDQSVPDEENIFLEHESDDAVPEYDTVSDIVEQDADDGSNWSYMLEGDNVLLNAYAGTDVNVVFPKKPV